MCGIRSYRKQPGKTCSKHSGLKLVGQYELIYSKRANSFFRLIHYGNSGAVRGRVPHSLVNYSSAINLQASDKLFQWLECSCYGLLYSPKSEQKSIWMSCRFT